VLSSWRLEAFHLYRVGIIGVLHAFEQYIFLIMSTVIIEVPELFTPITFFNTAGAPIVVRVN
jgi:small nuclear ribonucleoprotein (snRNP)-like protein